MPKYLVVWKMEIEADDERSAAKKALAIHRDEESIATVFSVSDGDQETVVDLMDGRFENYYACPECGETWQDTADCKCDDRCPGCDTSCSPYESKDI